MGGCLVKKHYIKKKGYYHLKHDRSLHRGVQGLKSHFVMILFEVGLNIIILVYKKCSIYLYSFVFGGFTS